MKILDNEWRDVPGGQGFYQINREGQVRSWRCSRGNRFSKKPRLLSSFVRKKGRRGQARFVKITDAQGKSKDVKVLSIMVDVWLGGQRDGMVPYHKNGDLDDNSINNIGFISREQLGKKTGAMSRRRTVAKVDRFGNVIAFYPSARSAAKANHMSYQTVNDRCNGKVKNPFELDGTTYRWDD